MIPHFLITRFNLKKRDWNADKNSQIVLDEKWLRNRIKLFEKFCLPSVLGQTTKKFTWLIFFERDSRGEVAPLVKKLEQHSFIYPIFVTGYDGFQNNLSKYISEKLPEEPEWVLTSRLDNDDAINKEFISYLQNSFAPTTQDTVLHFPHGLFLEIGEVTKLGSAFYPLNQFVSLLEQFNAGNFKTVLSREHDSWNSDFIIKEITLGDAWLQVTHSQNMVNSFKGNYAFSRRLNCFSIGAVQFKWNYDLKIAITLLRRRFRKFFKLESF